MPAQSPQDLARGDVEQADVALVWLRPSVYQRPEHDYADIALSPLTGIDVARVKEIEAVIFFKQIEGEEYRVSMRSKGDIDIGSIAKAFGGGGHKNAAGCTVHGPIETLQKTFVERIDQAIQTTASA